MVTHKRHSSPNRLVAIPRSRISHHLTRRFQCFMVVTQRELIVLCRVIPISLSENEVLRIRKHVVECGGAGESYRVPAAAQGGWVVSFAIKDVRQKVPRGCVDDNGVGSEGDFFVFCFRRALPTSVMARRRMRDCVSSFLRSLGCVRLTKLKQRWVELSIAEDICIADC
jgi:hypothetical protein